MAKKKAQVENSKVEESTEITEIIESANVAEEPKAVEEPKEIVSDFPEQKPVLKYKK